MKHYAGDVVYDVRGMLEKNADRLSRNLYMLLTAATNPRTAAIFPERDERTAGKVSTLTVRVRVRLRVRVRVRVRVRPSRAGWSPPRRAAARDPLARPRRSPTAA